MTDISFLLDTFRKNARSDAVVWKGRSFSYQWLLDSVETWQSKLADAGLVQGEIVSLEADFSPEAIGALLALVQAGCVVVPLTSSVEASKPVFRSIAEVEVVLEIRPHLGAKIQRTGRIANHTLFDKLREIGHPGLVLFSSGSTGTSKAVVHDFAGLLEKFKVPRHAYRAMTFLLFDHIGGVNTLLYTLANGGCVVTVEERSPESISETIEIQKVELLPTSPTFLNLLLASEAYRRFDLSSLKLVTYGTEIMPEGTLTRLREVLPHARLLQTYGLSEVGILRSKSKSSDSLWMKVGGEGFETRVVDGKLQIKAQSAMLGYLNAPSPFTPDGWLVTDDVVEVDGEYIRILGRESEIINVGGRRSTLLRLKACCDRWMACKRRS